MFRAQRLAAALLLCSCSSASGLGLSLRQPGEPGARHIRYLFAKRGLRQAGISDRIVVFTILAELGEMHNATVHLRDFAAGPGSYLSRQHSPNVSDRWEHYFDTSANHGNPWHDLEDLQGCVPLLGGGAAGVSDLFDGGTTCVDIPGSIYRFPQWQKIFARGRARIPPSREVVEAADRVTRESRLADAGYGSVHIRRCDRKSKSENQQCTSPESVARAVDRFPDIGTWVVFVYAEHGYAEHLRGALDRPGRTLLFEDDMRLNPAGDGDNYFAFMVSREIVNRAQIRVNTHLCHGSDNPYVEESSGQRRAAVYDVALADAEAGALCGGH